MPLPQFVTSVSDLLKFYPFALPFVSVLQVRVQENGKQVTLGSYATEEEAARKYDECARRLGRPVNFPEAGEKSAFKRRRTEEVIDMGRSRYRGVNWAKRDQRWKAEIKWEGKQKHLGYFITEEDAARRYDEFAAQIGKPVNFPGEGQRQAHKRGGVGGGGGGSCTARSPVATPTAITPRAPEELGASPLEITTV